MDGNKQISGVRTLEELPPLGEWKDEMLTYFSEGMSEIEVMSKLRISKRAWKQLKEVSDLFCEMVEFGNQLCEARWHELTRKSVFNENDMNASALKMNMANRYGWSDKVESKQEVIDQSDLSKADLLRMVQEKLQRLGGDGGVLEGEFKVVEQIGVDKQD